VKSFNIKNSTDSLSRRDDAFHLTSIIIVILLSLLAWGVESMSASSPRVDVSEFLELLDTWPVGDRSNASSPSLSNVTNDNASSNRSYSRPYSKPKRFYNSNALYAPVVTPEPLSININDIDSVSLERLPVFGPVLSGRTVKYRKLLGGFVDVRQLQEVYGFNDESFNDVAGWFKVDSENVVQICIDTASWSQMRKHPYIGFEGARMIERYRRHHEINKLDDLRQMPLMNDSMWKVWSPYIKVVTINDHL
jgi:DNA uptake protein ComE-like DNA-binding protein